MTGRLFTTGGPTELMPGVEVRPISWGVALVVNGTEVLRSIRSEADRRISRFLTSMLVDNAAEALGLEARGVVLTTSSRRGQPTPTIALETVDGYPVWVYTTSGIPTAEQLREAYRATRARADALEDPE